VKAFFECFAQIVNKSIHLKVLSKHPKFKIILSKIATKYQSQYKDNFKHYSKLKNKIVSIKSIQNINIWLKQSLNNGNLKRISKQYKLTMLLNSNPKHRLKYNINTPYSLDPPTKTLWLKKRGHVTEKSDTNITNSKWDNILISIVVKEKTATINTHQIVMIIKCKNTAQMILEGVMSILWTITVNILKLVK